MKPSSIIESIVPDLVGYKITYGDLKNGFVRINLNKSDMKEFKEKIAFQTSPIKFTSTKLQRYRGVIDGIFVLIVPTESPRSTVAVSFDIERINNE